MSDEIKQALDILHLSNKEVKDNDNKVIVVLDSSDEYSRVYTALDKWEDATLDPEGMVMSVDTCIMTYLTDNLDITLRAELNNDKYFIVIEEAK